MYNSQFKSGEKYQEAKTCIGIHFLDFIVEPDIDKFYSPYGFMHREKACHPHSNELYLIYIELPKVNYEQGEFTALKKWLYFIENVYKKEDPMIQTLRKEVPEIDQAALEYENFIADLRFQHAIQAREMAELDYASGMHNARNEGKAEGLAEGKTQGLAITARNLKTEGFDNEKISKLTGLSIQEIEAL